MRLSDIKGERVFDVIADIIDPIANIATRRHQHFLGEKSCRKVKAQGLQFLAA